MNREKKYPPTTPGPKTTGNSDGHLLLIFRKSVGLYFTNIWTRAAVTLSLNDYLFLFYVLKS